MDFKKYGAGIIIGFIFIAIFIFYIAGNGNNNLFKVVFLDVGDGNAVFIRTPNGNQILINAGSNISILRALGRVMPFYDRNIDALIAIDNDQASIGGMPEVLKYYKVGAYIGSENENGGEAYKEIKKEITEKKIKTNFVQSGSKVDLGAGAYLHVLYVNDQKNENNYIVAQITYGKKNYLIVPDTVSENIENYITSIFSDKLKSAVFLVSHSGAKNYLSDMFLSAVSPQFSVIAVDKNNKYGYPGKETLDLLAGVKSTVLETSSGDIVFISDGQNIDKI